MHLKWCPHCKRLKSGTIKPLLCISKLKHLNLVSEENDLTVAPNEDLFDVLIENILDNDIEI